jgi:hypothetical protein
VFYTVSIWYPLLGRQIESIGFFFSSSHFFSLCLFVHTVITLLYFIKCTDVGSNTDYTYPSSVKWVHSCLRRSVNHVLQAHTFIFFWANFLILGYETTKCSVKIYHYVAATVNEVLRWKEFSEWYVPVKWFFTLFAKRRCQRRRERSKMVMVNGAVDAGWRGSGSEQEVELAQSVTTCGVTLTYGGRSSSWTIWQIYTQVFAWFWNKQLELDELNISLSIDWLCSWFWHVIPAYGALVVHQFQFISLRNFAQFPSIWSPLLVLIEIVFQNVQSKIDAKLRVSKYIGFRDPAGTRLVKNL